MSTRRLLVIVAVAVALTGCTAPEQTPAAAPTTSPSAVESPTPTPTPTPEAVSPIPPSTPVDPAAYFVPGWAGGVSFLSPSGNLSCGILTYNGATIDLWGCAIHERYWDFPDDVPGDVCYQSEISCGAGIVSRPAFDGGVPGPLIRGGAEFADEGGFAVQVLPYGQSVSYLGITCASTSEHVICADDLTGRGFVISRDENIIF